ncbi:TRAP transporter TatT component family protein [Sandaracinus amylolyticus]|uniref:Uncharacterized protein n=1 Tax=Sandaracinus amylolyticus TaxID=927083 RepID=A0A0F6SH72_9BACT|nr:TRAP transporter TatT component family protein [Sandaracinus amylolyticus]AKF09939.1 hypothetical protein DB32_007088 [Sandaracinus amylolyticus]
MNQRSSSQPRLARSLGIVIALVAVPASLPLFGCDTGVFAANTTIGVMRRASPGVQRMRDPEILEIAFPASIQQMEGLLEIKPDDNVLRAMLGRSYASFGYGFIEDDYEVAQLSDDATEEQIEHLRERASQAYLRGREVAIGGLDMARPEGGGLLAVQSQGLEAFTAHVNRFDSRENHAPLLFWAAYNWVRWISLHRDDMGAIADLAYVTALAERAYELDQTYMDYGPIALRAGLMAAAPPQLGGRPQDARVELERAIELTERKNLLYLVTMAQLVAIPLQDRALFESMLNEVVAFDVDSFPDQRIPNLLAQRRARRLLAQIDDLVPPPIEDEGEAEGEASEPSASVDGAASPSST